MKTRNSLKAIPFLALLFFGSPLWSQSHDVSLPTSTTVTMGNSDDHEAILTISLASGNSFIVEAGGSSTMIAGQEILLEEDFEVKAGGEFCAIIDAIPTTYIELKKELNASYEELQDDRYLNFTFDEYYTQEDSKQLDFEVFDEQRNTVSLGSFPLTLGDNRYILDASTLSTGYYTLKVNANKNKSYYLRFQKQ
jgi:hypothetical protein